MAVVYELLKQGGPITWVIALFGILSLLIIAERALHLHRAQINVPEFLRGILNILKRGNVLEAISICDDTPGPVARVVRAPLMHCAESERAQQQAVREAGLSEIPRLEKRLKLLLALAYLAPLLGLLGTVGGMIELFQRMETTGTFFKIEEISGSVWTALLSTAAGLVVAIPSLGFYNHFRAQVDMIVLDMEKAASEILFYLSEHPLDLDNAELGGKTLVATETENEGGSEAQHRD